MLHAHLRSRSTDTWSVEIAHDGDDFLVAMESNALESLSLVMRQFATDLGAESALLTLRDTPDGRASILYSDAPLGVRDAIVARASKGSRRAVHAAFALAGSSSIEWETVELDDQDWSILDVPIRSQGGRLFSVALVFRGSEIALEASAMQSLQRTRPFLTGFLSVWSTQGLLKNRLDSLASALDHSSVGVILLDGGANLVFANSAAEKLLSAGDSIRRSGGSITAKNMLDSLRLQVAIEHVLARTDGDHGTGSPVVALRRSGKARPLMISLTGTSMRDVERDPNVIMYLFDPDLDVLPLLAPACRLYGLSPVEIRLTSLLVSGACLAEAAASMRVKEQTARTYLKQIFQKTDVNRQADLVRLMLTSIVHTSGTDLSSII